MKYGKFSAVLTAGIAVFSQVTPVLGAAEAPLKVFLQGNSSDDLQALVEAQGGLHLIDAVGAELTREQLDLVLQSPRVGRFFDDLSVSGQPAQEPVDEEESCDIGGSLELDIKDSQVSWTLFNKLQGAASLERLKMAWPAELGSIRSISLGSAKLDPELYQNAEAGSVSLEFMASAQAKAPTLSGTQNLTVTFDSSPAKPLRQREFEFTAEFTGDCSLELIPGYDDNHENFHYNSVVGVDALQLNGVTGRGITVAVIDSGLWDDPALINDTNGKPRVLARYDAIGNSASDGVFDASGHGTHMTSVIAHSGATTKRGKPTGTFKGVAPDVSLVSVKAFDVEGQGDFLDIVRAIQWVVDNRETYNIRVLNLSFAARPRWHYWLDPINQALMHAWASGITVVAAAGNEGPDSMTIGSPGNLPFIITVGAVTDSWTPADKDDDYIPDFSSRGPTPSGHIKPDIVAPGGHITGLTRPGSSLTRDHPEYMLGTGELVMTGSSQATALVSGVVALLLQLEPDLSPDDIKCKLMSSAEPAINRDGLLAYSPFQQGRGYLSATRAVTLGERGCGNAEMDISVEMGGTGHSRGPAIVDDEGNPSLPGLAEMLSPDPAAKGISNTRKWGAKAHIEMLNALPQPPATPDKAASPFDWIHVYEQERQTIENLSRQPTR
jgi:subtilisin family serine protease